MSDTYIYANNLRGKLTDAEYERRQLGVYSRHATDSEGKLTDAEYERRQRQLACESACTGVSFTGDPTDAVKALVEALQGMIDLANLLNESDCDYFADMEAARAVLARVRLDGEK